MNNPITMSVLQHIQNRIHPKVFNNLVGSGVAMQYIIDCIVEVLNQQDLMNEPREYCINTSYDLSHTNFTIYLLRSDLCVLKCVYTSGNPLIFEIDSQNEVSNAIETHTVINNLIGEPRK